MANLRGGKTVAKTRVVGLDIGTSAVRAAELEFSSGGPGAGRATLHKFAEVALPPGAVRDGEVIETSVVTSALKQLWQRGAFSTKKVNIGVGNQRVIVRDLELPWMPLDALRRTLPFQAQELLPVAVDGALLDFYPTGESTGETGRLAKGLFVAAVRETVTSNVLACESAGLTPQMVDLNAFALVRALAQGDDARRTVAIVEIGARITTIVIASQGMPVLVRILAQGGDNATDGVASALRTTQLEADRLKREIGIGYTTSAELAPAAESIAHVSTSLVESVRGTLSYYAQGHPQSPVESMILSGGAVMLPGLGQFIASATRLPVSLANAVQHTEVSKSASSVSGIESRIALPVGLAYGVAA